MAKVSSFIVPQDQCCAHVVLGSIRTVLHAHQSRAAAFALQLPHCCPYWVKLCHPHFSLAPFQTAGFPPKTTTFGFGGPGGMMNMLSGLHPLTFVLASTRLLVLAKDEPVNCLWFDGFVYCSQRWNEMNLPYSTNLTRKSYLQSFCTPYETPQEYNDPWNPLQYFAVQ